MNRFHLAAVIVVATLALGGCNDTPKETTTVTTSAPTDTTAPVASDTIASPGTKPRAMMPATTTTTTTIKEGATPADQATN